MTMLEAIACAVLGVAIFGSVSIAALRDAREMFDEGDRG